MIYIDDTTTVLNLPRTLGQRRDGTPAQYYTKGEIDAMMSAVDGRLDADNEELARLDEIKANETEIKTVRSTEQPRTVLKVNGELVPCRIANSTDEIISSSGLDKIYYFSVSWGQKIRLVCVGDVASYIRYGFTSAEPQLGSTVTNVVRYPSVTYVADTIVVPYDGYFVLSRNSGYFLTTFSTKLITERYNWDYLVEQSVDLSICETVNRWIQDNGKWNTNESYRSVFVPITNNEILTVKANAVDNTRISFLTSTEVIAGDSAPIVRSDVAVHIVNAGETQQFVAPEGSQYACIYLGSISGGLPRTPESVVIKSLSDINAREYRNRELCEAAKKRFLTKTEQQALGMTPSAHYNDCTLHQIVHITDIHGDWVRSARAAKFADAIGASVVDSGDTIGGTHAASYEGGDYTAYRERMLLLGGLYVNCIGNHECWTFHSESQLYSNFIQPYASQFGWHTGNASYYYADDTENKLRYISLNAWYPYGSSPSQGMNYGQVQINWFISTLNSVPAGYGVIVVMHRCDCLPQKTSGYDKFWQQTMYEPYSAPAIAPISTLVDAFISGTSYSGTMVDGDGQTLSLSADFSGAASHEFICYITGHTHKDAIFQITGVNNIQLVCICATGNSHYNSTGNTLAELSDLARNSEDELQDCFNVYTIDREKGVLKIVRIGSDMPFDFSEKRDCMTIPYK